MPVNIRSEKAVRRWIGRVDLFLLAEGSHTGIKGRMCKVRKLSMFLSMLVLSINFVSGLFAADENFVKRALAFQTKWYEKDRPVDDQTLADVGIIMKSYAMALRDRLERKYHDKHACLPGKRNGCRSEKSSDALDENVAALEFLVDFVRARYLLPTGFIKSMYVWNTGATDGVLPPVFLDKHYVSQSVLRLALKEACDSGDGQPGGCFGDRKSLWVINFKIDVDNISTGRREGEMSRIQCNRCIEIEEKRKKFPKSIVFSSRRSEAQIEAAMAVKEQVELELMLEKYWIKPLRKRFENKYPDASLILRRLFDRPGGELKEALSAFHDIVESVLEAAGGQGSGRREESRNSPEYMDIRVVSEQAGI